jgi:hypothetical protein
MLALTSCSRAIIDTEVPGWYEASTTLRLNTVGKFGRRPGRRAGAISKIVSTKKWCPLSWLIWRTVRSGC